jgi:hypothetical protein
LKIVVHAGAELVEDRRTLAGARARASRWRDRADAGFSSTRASVSWSGRSARLRLEQRSALKSSGLR